MFYKDDDYKTYKNRILLALDGFYLGLPNVEKLRKKFGTQKKQNGESRYPIASCIALYYILNEPTIYSNIRRYKTSERKMAEKGIDKMLGLIPNKKYLLVANRAFPSIGVLVYLAAKNIDFVIRNQAPFLKEFSSSELKKIYKKR